MFFLYWIISTIVIFPIILYTHKKTEGYGFREMCRKNEFFPWLFISFIVPLGLCIIARFTIWGYIIGEWKFDIENVDVDS